MKGIIVDRKGSQAVVLTGDGSFIKIGNKAHYRPGYEIEFEKPCRLKSGMLARISSIAAVFLFALGLSYGVYSYTTPYSYVDFDINPSIELTANIYDIIIKTETFNEDGEKLLQNYKLNFKKLDEGITQLVDSAIEQGYLKTESENTVLLTVTSKDKLKKEELEKHVENAALKALNESKVESAVISRQVSSQTHDTAKDMGISPGKLNLMEKALKEEPALDMEALKDKPVKDIMKIIGDSRKDKTKDKNTHKQEGKEKRKQGRDDKKQDRESGSNDSRAFNWWLPAKDSMQKKQDKAIIPAREKKQDKENNPIKAVANFTGWTNGQRYGSTDAMDVSYGNKSIGQKEKNQKTDKKDKNDKNNRNDKSGKDKKGSGNQRPKNKN